MAQGRFAAQVSAWAKKTEGRIEAVYKESAARVIRAAQVPVGSGGNMPIDTGFLRASLVVGLGSDLPAQTFNPGEGRFSFDAISVDLVISGADIKTPITAAWTANYARHVEYGARGRAGHRFVGLAAQQWQGIVAEVCREAESRAGG